MALNFRSKQWLAGIGLLVCRFCARVLTAPFVMKDVFHKHDFPPPPPHEIAQIILDRLSDDLNLSEEQVQKIRPTVVQAANKVETLRQSIEPQIRSIFDNQTKEVDQFLTPEQQKLFHKRVKEFHERHEEMEKRRMSPPQ